MIMFVCVDLWKNGEGAKKAADENFHDEKENSIGSKTVKIFDLNISNTSYYSAWPSSMSSTQAGENIMLEKFGIIAILLAGY